MMDENDCPPAIGTYDPKMGIGEHKPAPFHLKGIGMMSARSEEERILRAKRRSELRRQLGKTYR